MLNLPNHKQSNLRYVTFCFVWLQQLAPDELFGITGFLKGKVTNHHNGHRLHFLELEFIASGLHPGLLTAQ